MKLCEVGSALGAVLAVLLGIMPPAFAGTPPDNPQLRIEAGMHTAMINTISADSAGRVAVTSSDDKTARVWDLRSGRLLQILRPPIGAGDEGKVYVAALSPDGRTVAAGGWTGYEWDRKESIYLFDRTSGRLSGRLQGMPDVINYLRFSADGRFLAAVLGTGGLRVWRLPQADSGTDIPAPFTDDSYGDRSNGLSWSEDNRLATTDYDGQIRLYQVSDAGLERIGMAAAPASKRPFRIAFSPDGQELAVGYNDTPQVSILDGRTLELRYTPGNTGVNNGNLLAVAWSIDGKNLLAAGTWDVGGLNPVRRWPQAGRGAPIDTPASSNTIMDLRALPNGLFLVGAADPVWGFLDPARSDATAWRPMSQPPIADFRNYEMSASGDARTVQFSFELWGKAPYRFDIARRGLLPGTDAQLPGPVTQGLDVQNWNNSYSPTLAGQPIKLSAYETCRGLAIAPEAAGFALSTEWNLRYFDAQGRQQWVKAAPAAVRNVNIPASGKVVIAAYSDGTIRWHRLSDGQELLALFPAADRKRWVLWTPSGYYDASPGGEDLIGWHLNHSADEAADFYPASKFRDRYYRPDIIDRVLDTLDEPAAVAQANAARGTGNTAVNVAQVLPPVVDLLSDSSLRTASSQVTLRVQARTAADAPITAWSIRVNGQLQPDARGLQRQDSTDTGTARELTVTVPPKDSQIQVFASNRNGTSTAAVVQVAWAGGAPQNPVPTVAGNDFQVQPKLYVLAVGVAQYKDSSIPGLGLPAKDATDFAATLQAQKGHLYRDVEVKLLTDQNATADAVIDGLDWLQKQVTQHDVGMVFVAGHGTNDPTIGYTFLPYDANPDRLRRTSVPMEEFKRTLSNLVGKSVFFLDTCHSGNVLGPRSRGADNNITGVVNELSSAENGVVVFSSSSGRQLSYEDPAWGNGAFTKALVEGLKGGADYNHSGRITYKMLDLYVSDRVKQLTNGNQSPVTQAPGGTPDFPLVVVK